MYKLYEHCVMLNWTFFYYYIEAKSFIVMNTKSNNHFLVINKFVRQASGIMQYWEIVIGKKSGIGKESIKQWDAQDEVLGQDNGSELIEGNILLAMGNKRLFTKYYRQKTTSTNK